MHAETFAETLAQADELIRRVAARLQSRIGGQLRDLCIHDPGGRAAPARHRRYVLRQTDGPRGSQGSVGAGNCRQ